MLAAQAVPLTQKTPLTPSTLISLWPAAHLPLDGAAAVDVGADVVVVGVVEVVAGATVDVATGVTIGDTEGVAAGVVVGVVVGARPTLQPNTPEATFPQYEPSGRPGCGTGHEPMLVSVPMQMGDCAQKTPGTPSTLIGLLPDGHEPLTVDGALVGAAVVDTGAVVVATGVDVGVGVGVGAAVVGVGVEVGAAVVGVGVTVGALPALQPYTSVRTSPQYEPSGNPVWIGGHEPAPLVAMQTEPVTQKTPGTPSTLISNSPASLLHGA
jgi:hypothetical protein